MNRLSALFMTLAVLVSSCDREQECPPQICTYQFVSVTLSFTDPAGDPVPVSAVRATNTRSGRNYPVGPVNDPRLPSVYGIVSDLDKESLSGQGDLIRVTAQHERTGQVKTAELVVSGGKCVCHIQKLSGPDRVTFDPADQVSSK